MTCLYFLKTTTIIIVIIECSRNLNGYAIDFFKSRKISTSKQGLYITAVGLLPVFSSKDRLQPITGSKRLEFSRLLDQDHIVEREDKSLFGCSRTEIVCPRSGLSIGVVMKDDSSPTGKRYIANPCSLRFQEIYPVDKKTKDIKRYEKTKNPSPALPIFFLKKKSGC